jgi:hypothetical protein
MEKRLKAEGLKAECGGTDEVLKTRESSIG